MSFPLDKSQYTLQDIIVHKSFSDVYIAQCLSNKQQLTIKIIKLDLCPINVDHLQEETAFWRASTNKNILQLYGMFVTDNSLWILTEFMAGGSCYDILQFSFNQGFKNEGVISTIIHDVVSCLNYMHSNGQVHKQIRSSNILISKDGEVKVANFGLATSLLEELSSDPKKKKIVGITAYLPPEAINGAPLTFSSDIWSLGITAIELATGSTPYGSVDPVEQIKLITNNSPPQLPSTFSPEFRDFVKQCLEFDADKRPSASALLNHPFLAKASSPSCIKSIIDELPPLQQRYSIIYGKRKQKGLDYPKDQKLMVLSLTNEDDQKVKHHSSLKVGRFTVTVDNAIPEKHHHHHHERHENDKDHRHIPPVPTKNDESTSAHLTNLFKELKLLVSRTSTLEVATMDLYGEVAELADTVKSLQDQKKAEQES